MAFRGLCFLLFAMLLPTAGQAADCVSVRQGDVSLAQDAACGNLRVAVRKRDDPRPNIDIAATWIEFTVPGNAGEWRYNDWIRKQVATLNFDKPINLTPDLKSEDRLVVDSLYRSERLISARYARWVCCGSHGDTIYSSVNVDIERWTLLAPDDLVDRAAAANFCWRQFGDLKKRGDAFAKAYPRERPWTEDDFDGRQIGPIMRDMIGPVVINPQPSRDRSQRIFTSVVKDQGRWSFTGQGALIDFGELLGFAPGPFFCTFQNADLKEMARPGAAFPP
jgi:hypothetical protein